MTTEHVTTEVALIKQQITAMNSKFLELANGFLKHMNKEEESFKTIGSRLYAMEKELQESFKERDAKYLRMVETQAESKLLHEREMGDMRTKMAKVWAAATTIVAIIAIGMKVLV